MTATLETRDRVRPLCEREGKMVGGFNARLPILEIHAFLADSAPQRLVSPHMAELLLQGEDYRQLVMHSPFATGAIIAYPAPGERLGREICYLDCEGRALSLPTYDFAGESGIALFVSGVSAGDFSKDGGGSVICVPRERIAPVEGFPQLSGWHLPDPRTFVPRGKEIRGPLSRYLSRTKTSYVGPICRGVSYDAHGRDHVIADFGLFYKLGIVVEQDA